MKLLGTGEYTFRNVLIDMGPTGFVFETEGRTGFVFETEGRTGFVFETEGRTGFVFETEGLTGFAVGILLHLLLSAHLTVDVIF